ncbi:hypothetical protein D4740_12625 [Actinomyces sp. 2119]|uniref:hypothetical protein n=1 Tax=Actinomyces sp. 2119 TaxID=2321393 RepID=UPI000E6C1C2B|nr:hypothetical protein [Actinomyces sp. 2119]RJF40102.1 hypothetical protein D4740_12625 [Actinomyces sp. 2119]
MAGEGAPVPVPGSGVWWRRVVRAVVVAVVLVLVAAGARLWWENPSRRSVELPEGIEQGVVLEMSSSIGPLYANTGCLQTKGLRSQGHEWVGTMGWSRADPETGRPAGEEETFELRLGESFYAEGLGTVTLLAVNPPPIRTPLSSGDLLGGWTHRVNIVPEPGVVPEEPYRRLWHELLEV